MQYLCLILLDDVHYVRIQGNNTLLTYGVFSHVILGRDISYDVIIEFFCEDVFLHCRMVMSGMWVGKYGW
jgi:hypothetical protein